MEYRSYRDTDCRPSLLGLGCMRLPTLEPGGTAIDYARAGALVDEAVRGGITYFDVAYPYHGGGAEKFIGAALEKYPRESFYLATKMPLWKLETQEDMEQVFNEQLANCRVDYFDFYLCHAVDAERFEKIDLLRHAVPSRHRGFRPAARRLLRLKRTSARGLHLPGRHRIPHRLRPALDLFCLFGLSASPPRIRPGIPPRLPRAELLHIRSAWSRW